MKKTTERRKVFKERKKRKRINILKLETAINGLNARLVGSLKQYREETESFAQYLLIASFSDSFSIHTLS